MNIQQPKWSQGESTSGEDSDDSKIQESGYNTEEREEKVIKQYSKNNVTVIRQPAELVNLEFLGLKEKLDEAWSCGVLQHVLDPNVILKNMANIAKRVRIIDWGWEPPHDGHPWMLTDGMIRSALGPLGNELFCEKRYINIDAPVTDSKLVGVGVAAIYDIH